MRRACLALSVLVSGAAWAQVPLDPYGPQTAQPIVVPPPTVPPPTPYAPPGPYVPPPVPPPASPWNATDGCDEGCNDPAPYVRPYIPQPYPPFPQRPIARPDARRVRLIAGGITLFATSWVSATIDAAFGTTPYVIIPLAGPIIATVDYQRNYVHTGSVQLESVLLVFDAAAQTAGLIMTIVGASMKPRPPGTVRVSWAGTGVRGTF
jgi:hypothetical protein